MDTVRIIVVLGMIILGIWLFIKILPLLLKLLVYSTVSFLIWLIMTSLIPFFSFNDVYLLIPIFLSCVLVGSKILSIRRKKRNQYQTRDIIREPEEKEKDISGDRAVEIGLFLSILGISLLDAWSKTGSGGEYVLNRKSGVIHDRYDDSVDTISEKNQKLISYSEAQELINRGTKYRWKE